MVSSTVSWNLLRAEGMFWLWQMLVMALPTSRRLAWALAQVSQGPRGNPVVCVGMLRLLSATLRAALGWELPETSLSGAQTLDDRHREVDWATSVEVLNSKTSGKQRFRRSFSGFPAWGVDCSVGISFLQAFFCWRAQNKNRAHISRLQMIHKSPNTEV